GDEHLVIEYLATALQVYRVVQWVHPNRPLTEARLDVVVRVETGWLEQRILERFPTLEVLLRQWWSFVWRMWLCTDEYDLAVEALFSQGYGGCTASQVGSNNHI